MFVVFVFVEVFKELPIVVVEFSDIDHFNVTV